MFSSPARPRQLLLASNQPSRTELVLCRLHKQEAGAIHVRLARGSEQACPDSVCH